jgi:SAM-dependent methyltransferase
VDYKLVEENLCASYREQSARYRCDDEIEVTTGHHRHLRGVLEELSGGFGRPISVLDVGCGTGRYFHCLRNVETLVGIDISPEMLQAAEHPVREQEVTARTICLRRANAFAAAFPAESFDLIYSLGMFGFGCPVTVDICDRFHAWLKPGGTLFFNTIDRSSLPLAARARRRARGWVYPALPRRWRAILDERSNRAPMHDLTRPELEAILRASRFRRFTVRRHGCDSPLWRGAHLECLAVRKGN